MHARVTGGDIRDPSAGHEMPCMSARARARTRVCMCVCVCVRERERERECVREREYMCVWRWVGG